MGSRTSAVTRFGEVRCLISAPLLRRGPPCGDARSLNSPSRRRPRTLEPASSLEAAFAVRPSTSPVRVTHRKRVALDLTFRFALRLLLRRCLLSLLRHLLPS